MNYVTLEVVDSWNVKGIGINQASYSRDEYLAFLVVGFAGGYVPQLDKPGAGQPLPASSLPLHISNDMLRHIELCRNVVEIFQDLGLWGEYFGELGIRGKRQAIENSWDIDGASWVFLIVLVSTVLEAWWREAREHLFAHQVPPGAGDRS